MCTRFWFVWFICIRSCADSCRLSTHIDQVYFTSTGVVAWLLTWHDCLSTRRITMKGTGTIGHNNKTKQKQNKRFAFVARTEGGSKTFMSSSSKEILNFHPWVKYKSFNLWTRYFVWNFKGRSWNSTKKSYSYIERWIFLVNIEVSRARKRFWNTPLEALGLCLGYVPALAYDFA